VAVKGRYHARAGFRTEGWRFVDVSFRRDVPGRDALCDSGRGRDALGASVGAFVGKREGRRGVGW
jgi:hypothetical protein